MISIAFSDASTLRSGASRHPQGFSQSTALIQLDVYSLVTVGEAQEIFMALDTLICGDRNRRLKSIQPSIFTDGERLLNEGNAGLNQYGE